MSEERADIVRQFCAILEDEGWEPGWSAIEKIVNTSLKNKEGLQKMLSRHSAWDEDTMRITMPIETNGERIDVSDKMEGFRCMCENIDLSPLDVFESVLTRGGMLTPDDCNALQAKGYTGGKMGQKIGRAINAWATAHGIEKHKDYNWRFNELINGGGNTTDRTAILSINPVDFLAASHGDFTSCHHIGHQGNSCHKSGNLSYAMDDVTMVFFTIVPDESADYPTKRIDRINYHWDSGLLIQGRLYTGTKDNIHAVSRAMVCKVIADCLDVPNLWTKHAKIDQSRIESTGNHYPDYAKNTTACSMSTLSGAAIPDTISIGHAAYCISCGDRQSDSSVLDCCDVVSDMLSCNSCEASIHEDDAIWVGDSCYCSDCATYCEHCGSYHHRDDVRWVESLRTHLCDSCFENDFCECIACEKVIKKGDEHDKDGDCYCEDCYHEQFSGCDECGETFDNKGLMETDDGCWVCRDCHAKRTEQESCGLATV